MGNTKDFGGISSPFTNAITPVPGNAGDGVTKSGGFDLKDGQKQTSGGQTGQDVTNVSLPGESGADHGPARPSGMAGS